MFALIFIFLVSGNSKVSMSFNYRIAPSAVHSTSITTCEAIKKNTHNTITTTHRRRVENKGGRILFTAAVSYLPWTY